MNQESGSESDTMELSTSDQILQENQSSSGSLLIEKILWRTFIEVSVTNNFSLVGGEDKWEDILCEYADNIHSPKSDNIIECWNKIKFIEAKIKFVGIALDILKDVYLEKIVLCLCELGFDYIENNQNVVAYHKSLEMLDIEARVLIVLLNQYQTEYISLAGNSENIKRTRMDFEKEMAILRKAGYKIKKNTTTFQMCAIINSFIDHPHGGRTII